MRALFVLLAGLTMVSASPVTSGSTPAAAPMAEAAVTHARTVMMTSPREAGEIGARLERAVAPMAASPGRSLAMSRALWIKGEAMLRSGSPDKARPMIESALSYAAEAGEDGARADVLLSRGTLLRNEGKPALALRDYLGAATLFRETGNARGQAISLQYLGILYDEAADYERAERYLHQAGSVYRKDPRLNISLANSLGWLAMERGNPLRAVEHYTQAARLARRLGDHGLEVRVLGNKAHAYIKAGRTEEAARALAEAEDIARSTKVQAPDEITAIKAEVLASQGRLAEAQREIDSLEPWGPDTGAALHMMIHETAYAIYKRAGRTGDALVQLEEIQRGRDRMTALALSNKAALLASRFDYDGQELRIAKMRADELRRRYNEQRVASERQWGMTVLCGIGAYVVVVFMTYGIITLRRSRDRERVAKEELAETNEALGRALEELRLRADAERHANMLAEHDTLTGLPNRRHLHERLSDLLSAPDTRCAVLLLDLDRFKAINDNHGHQTGDAVLQEVAARLKTISQDEDTITVRLGGDEFLMVMTGDISDEACENRAAEILQAIGAPYDIAERRHSLGTSIGIARYPDDGGTASELTRAADVAMYEAKRSGRNTHRFYDAEIDMRLRLRTAMEDDLRTAVRDGDIDAWFQPITCLRTGSVLGFEALARWRHPIRGMISPEEFIPIAEETGLIDQITTIVLQKACRAAREWPDDVSVSVNMSPLVLKDSWVIAKTFGILQQEHLRPERLVIEITENAVIDDVEFAREAIGAFRSAGIRVALDDFGCGYSSLSTLRELEFDHLKLDSSFSRTLGEGDSLKITTAVAGLARAMGLTVTAEGVETGTTAEMLVELGFDCGQGYLYGRPAPAEVAREIAHGGAGTSQIRAVA